MGRPKGSKNKVKKAKTVKTVKPAKVKKTRKPRGVKVPDGVEVLNFKTEGACRTWFKKNVKGKAEMFQSGKDYLWRLKDGRTVKMYMFGAEIRPKKK